MKYRICDHNNINSESEENDIYRKFKYQFDNLLNADETPQNDEEFEKMYVNNENFEKNFYDFLELYSNSMKFCVGYTGIGKTTSIRHCLQLGVSTVTKLNTKSRHSKDKYMIIFPTFLDGARFLANDQFDFIGRVASVCTALERENPELKSILRTFDGRKGFYNFICEHTPRILETKNDFEFLNYSDDDEIMRKLSYAQQFFPYEYYANKLKYYIKATNYKYDQLVVLLDDIETLSEIQQHEVIKEYLHFYSCMNNTDIPKEFDYRITMLISLRPHTLRMYRYKDQIEKYRGLEAFTVATNTVLKKNALDLSVFFKKRFDFYTSKSSKIIGNKESWDECYKNLMSLNDAFDGKYKSMIINLCFFNVRAALAIYSKVLANRFWLQGNRTKEIFFTIDSQHYNFNNINVIRAIGCGNSSVFTGEDETSVIPNIFLTDEKLDMDYSVYCMLVIQFFIKIAGAGINDDTIEITYGENAKKLKDVIKIWEDTVGKIKKDALYKALIYLFENKILRKSIEDTDTSETMDQPASIQGDSKLYISPRGHELMSMLSRDSVYFEMLRECAWREYNGHVEYSQLSSYELLVQRQQGYIFLDLLEYIDYLREEEENIFFSPGNKIDLIKYRDIFGASMMVSILLKGVQNSLNYSGLSNNEAIAKKFLCVQRNIDESTRKLQI